jgi:hypothetical protein
MPASPSSVLTAGLGSWGSVNLLVTDGFGNSATPSSQGSRRLFDSYPLNLYLIDATVGSSTTHVFNLPHIAVAGVRHYLLKRIDNDPSHTLTITPYGGDTIEGLTTMTLDVQYAMIELLSDGVRTWLKLGEQ